VLSEEMIWQQITLQGCLFLSFSAKMKRKDTESLEQASGKKDVMVRSFAPEALA